jgi:hypothetical protein
MSILQNEHACHYPELKNRAFLGLGMPSKRLDSICSALETAGQVYYLSRQAPSVNRKNVTFICDSNAHEDCTDRVVEEKLDLLGNHYDLSGEIGHHGEMLVAKSCEKLGYSEIEIRKEKHGPQGIGIARRDIDVFARHPYSEYYQIIEVKNRRQSVNGEELLALKQTAEMAHARWAIETRPALVAPFTHSLTRKKAVIEHIPIALSATVYVPEAYRSVYEELNERLALNVNITDCPSETLLGNIRDYVMGYQYPSETGGELN